MLKTIMDSDTNIRFSLVSDMYGNVETCRHREGEDNFLTEKETKDAIQYSADAWRIRRENSAKIGKGKYALVEYEKISRVTMPLSDERLLLVTIDNNQNPMKRIQLILNQVSYPKNVK